MVSVRSVLRILVVVLPVACGTGGAPRPVHPIEQPREPAADDARVDLDVTDAPLTNVLRDLAGEAQINILADPDLVAIPVTVAVHSAPWNDALSTIATQHQLRVEKLTNLLNLYLRDNATLASISIPLVHTGGYGGSFIVTNNPTLPTCMAQALATQGPWCPCGTQISGDDDGAVCD